MEDNICRFAPVDYSDNGIRILDFVYETHPDQINNYLNNNYYVIVVTNGTGIIKINNQDCQVTKGNLIIIKPAQNFIIQSTDKLKYIYIRCSGLRLDNLLSNKFSPKNFLIQNFPELIPVWIDGIISTNDQNITVASEGILLYSISKIIKKEYPKKHLSKNVFGNIQNYIYNNYSDFSLTVNNIAEIFHYNPKYLSNKYKSIYNQGLSDFINSVRIQKACSLINQGYTQVNQIALKVGFIEPAYFSKVFYKHKHTTPKAHIKEIQAQLKSGV